MTLLRFGPRELHTTDRPSSTAQWTTFGRTLELGRPEDERIVSDAYAPVFLSGTSRRLMAPLRLAEPLVRVAERSTFSALATSGLCRHAFIDEQLLEALPEVEQVMILGAGYDSRAYRFRRSIGQRPVYEVDLAPLSRRKAQIVAAHEDLFGRARIQRVEIDFRTQSLRDQLTGSGFRIGAPTFVVWEGVSMYLTPAAVDGTLQALASVCGSGSVLALDFWQRVAGRAAYDQVRRVGERAMRVIGEPIGFSIDATHAPGLLAGFGFEVVDLAVATDMTRRFATAGRHCDAGMYVAAARLA
ncbi:MAG TPA: SAM-dependent methyltransferase [Jatrophihabitans sp.]|uniref:class I SAM-dependent methyltransferase n=1 Tax=Jatrophihabitans sp. TaxID=1932789 RepID=UPI002DFAEFA1|nr:SAM-dependent methyltransferase [Jatrophihabitans sp.]